MNTGSRMNRATRMQTQTRGRRVRWKWCWRCGGGSVSRRRRCRRKAFQMDSPHTLRLCERWRTRMGEDRPVVSDRAKQSNRQHRSISDSRTDCFVLTRSRLHPLSFSSLCRSLQCLLYSSTPPPSNTDQSELCYTAAEARSQISPGDQDTAAPLSLTSSSCCRQTLWVFCELCLCR